MTGTEVKNMILSAGIKLWQVAECWGISDGNFSRRLRKTFNKEEVERIEAIIIKLKSEQKTA